MNEQDKERNLGYLWRGMQTLPFMKRTQESEQSGLAELLRYHSPKPIAASEVGPRDDWDKVLASYSKLAIAVIAGYVPLQFRGDIKDQIAATLSKDAVRVYYETHYKLLLPTLMRLHCSGQMVLPCEDTDEARGAFQWFWRFASRFEGNSELETFLWLMDDGYDRDFGLEELKGFLKDPAIALAGFGKLPDDRNIKESAVAGMLQFLEICRELDEALQEMHTTPLTRSAIWFYFAYWFEEYKSSIAQEADTFLQAMKGWLTEANRAAAQAAAENEERVRKALENLTSGVYSEALLDRVKEIA